MFRLSLCFLGVILSLPILALIGLALVLPITISGFVYLAGCLLAAIGLILAPWISKSYLAVIVGVIIIALVAGVRLILLRQNPSPGIRMISLPQGKETSWINTLIDEQDGLIFGEALFHLVGGDSAHEHSGITSALVADYSKIKAEQPVFPSPFASTYLNLEQPNHFDAVVIEPDVDYLPEFAVVFLHGYMGNVTAQCWEIAQAVKKLGGVTVCPSTEWTGQWWTPQGQAILQSTFEYVRGRGIQRIYLGGFSNGGFSIGHLASQLKNEKGLSGLIFIDGIYDGTGIKDTGLPVLIIQGAQDERVPASNVRQIADGIGDAGTYVELDGDHFIIMKQPEMVQNAIVQWLEKFESRK